MFQFKQFSIAQDRCAMKVGTDGVLLGAWTPLINNPYNILDLGTGTGVIALMLAQRSHAEQIDAIEIDDEAYAAGVVLKLWIIKALLWRKTEPLGLFFRRLGDLNVHLFKRLHLIFPGALIKLNRRFLSPIALVRCD